MPRFLSLNKMLVVLGFGWVGAPSLSDTHLRKGRRLAEATLFSISIGESLSIQWWRRDATFTEGALFIYFWQRLSAVSSIFLSHGHLSTSLKPVRLTSNLLLSVASSSAMVTVVTSDIKCYCCVPTPCTATPLILRARLQSMTLTQMTLCSAQLCGGDSARWVRCDRQVEVSAQLCFRADYVWTIPPPLFVLLVWVHGQIANHSYRTGVYRCCDRDVNESSLAPHPLVYQL